MLKSRSMIIASLLLAASMAMGAMVAAADGHEKVFPERGDPFVGDYVGRWLNDVTIDPDIAAQVIALGDGNYRVRLVPKLDMRCPPIEIFEVQARRGRIAFSGDLTRGEIRNGNIIGSDRDHQKQFEMKRVVRLSPTLGAEPPEGATVLFDGSNLDAWDGAEGWVQLDDGVVMATPKGGYLTTKQNFTDLKLHIEFRNSFMPSARGQQRSNSGVFLQDWYEVQVLDSYGLEGYYDECGGLYKLAAPHVNACSPPLQWQSFDIEYRAPRFDNEGELSEYGRMTVLHNGVLIHDNQELLWITAYTEKERLGPAPSEPGPVKLQAHGDYVQYRNIWLVDLAEGK